MQFRQILLIAVLTYFCWFQGVANAQVRFEEKTVQDATQVLDEIMAIPVKSIPRSILKDACGVAILPGMVKGGFIIGARHGTGVVVRKDKTGAWQLPFFVKLSGASLGLQAGLQSTDVILVFKTQRSVDGLKRNKFTIGADASVAAGPVGRQVAAATDAQLKAEILSYSRSRGLFAGVAVKGGVLRTDQRMTSAYYAPLPGQPAGAVPISSIQLVQRIATYTNPVRQNGVASPAFPPVAPGPGNAIGVKPVSEREQVRRRLVAASEKLQAIVDPQWRKYLALPQEVYAATPSPNRNGELLSCLSRYNAVLLDPRYKALTDRQEFKETRGFLEHLIRLETPRQPAVLKLPPPPRK